MMRSGRHVVIPSIMQTRVRAPASAAYVMTNFFSTHYTGTRNNYSGNVGFWFAPTTNITVLALGRSVSTAMAANHRVRIWRRSDWVVVADVTLTPASLTDALGYKYALLGSPVVLASGTNYAIASLESSGGDKFYDLASIANHAAVATVTSGCYSVGGDTVPSGFYGSANDGYGVPAFYW